MGERLEGFYWVFDGTKWRVAEWDGADWYPTGTSLDWVDEDFEKIGSKIDPPQS